MVEALNLPFAQSLHFTARAVLRTESANFLRGEDISLHLLVRGHDGQPCLIANDCLGGQWGEELRLPLTHEEALAPKVEVAFTAQGILITLAGGLPTPFRPGEALPMTLSPRHGPHVEAAPAALPALDPAPMTGEGIIEAAAALPGTRHRLLRLRLADPALEAAMLAAPVPMRLRDAQGLGAPEPALFCALPAGQGLFAALPQGGDGRINGAELLPPGRAPITLLPARGADFVPHLPPAAFLDLLELAEGPARGELARLLARGLTGRDTLAWLSAPVRLAVTRLLPTPEGLLLQGFLGDPHDAVVRIELCGGDGRSPLRPGAWVETGSLDGDGARGFLALAPTLDLAEGWLELTLRSGESGTLPLPAPVVDDKAGLRGVLTGAGQIPETQLQGVFGQVLGPALVALHRRHQTAPMAVEVQEFGSQPAAPRASLVIPLHGRLDMMPVQMALFSACRMAGDEIIFVLDDPPRRGSALAAAQSSWDRFGLPLRLVLPAEGRGFGPASNLGLRHARGQFVVFLNADAFPQSTDWLDRLVAAVTPPGVGAAGARLLYPDGSLQHGGMRMVPGGPGGWSFPEHPGKGLRPPPPAAEPREVEALTGACLALRREVAESFGGFDPDYVIGDFEDADLCARLRRAGLSCVMEDHAALVHLERQSQGRADEEAGRWNLTLLNAWSYHRKWGKPGPLPEG